MCLALSCWIVVVSLNFPGNLSPSPSLVLSLPLFDRQSLSPSLSLSLSFAFLYVRVSRSVLSLSCSFVCWLSPSLSLRPNCLDLGGSVVLHVCVYLSLALPPAVLLFLCVDRRPSFFNRFDIDLSRFPRVFDSLFGSIHFLNVLLAFFV